MTVSEINTILESTGLPVAYYQFDNDTPQQLPFICWLITAHNDVMADNGNYTEVMRLVIELYTESKDFALEQQLRAVLAENDIAFLQEGTEIDAEQMHLETFTTELVINWAEPPTDPEADDANNGGL